MSIARKNQQFAKKYYDYKNIKMTPLDENENLKSIVKSYSNEVIKEYNKVSEGVGYNLLNTTDILMFMPIVMAYQNAIDYAVLKRFNGDNIFNQEIEKQLKNIGKSGLKIHNMIDNKTFRLDNFIKLEMQKGIRDMINHLQREFGKEYESDGIEISVHDYPAPDHAFVQGHQFTNEEFEKFQSDMDATDINGVVFPAEFEGHDRRSIGEYNCYHYVFHILIGVDKPQYTHEDLSEIVKQNDNGFFYNGKHYTMYEGTQLQNRIRNEIQGQEDIRTIAHETGDKDLEMLARKKIVNLNSKYKDISDISGLPTEIDKLKEWGYKKLSKEDIDLQPFIQEYDFVDNTIKIESIITEPPLIKYQDIISSASYNEKIYEDMLKSYNNWYDSIDKKEIEEVLNAYQEHIEKTDSLNINKLGIKESNPLGEFINKKLGYDAKPELIDKKDFWIDEDGDPVEHQETVLLDQNHWYRGIEGDKAKEYIEEFKTGKYYAGEGYDGNGTFVTNSYTEALTYSGTNDENIIYIIPKENAKIIKYNQISNLGYEISKKIDFNKYQNEEGELYINFTDKVLNDSGYLSSLFGYDVIDFEPIDVRKIILNRGAIKVVK